MRTMKVTALLAAIVIVPVSLALVLVAKHDDRQSAVRTLTRSAAASVATAIGATSGEPADVRAALGAIASASPRVNVSVLDGQQHVVAVAREGRLLDARRSPAR